MANTAHYTRQAANKPAYSQKKVLSRAVYPVPPGASPVKVAQFQGKDRIVGVGLVGLNNAARADVSFFIQTAGASGTPSTPTTGTLSIVDAGALAAATNVAQSSLYSLVNFDRLGLDEETDYELVMTYDGADLDASTDDLAVIVDYLQG